ncbi:MAG: MlaD family protein [Rhodococcus sp. (in: high G+C Gram-positive bacteria)]|uniref:MCE family protein n=1 Tax=Rhodococcus sp. TaxID=1831 RepID=UPI003BB06178
MSNWKRRFRDRDLVSGLKLAAFVLVGVLSAVLVINTLRVPVEGSTVGYKALFTDAQGVTPGSDVTIAGVRVGKVNSVEIVDGDAGTATALVDFQVQRDQELPADTSIAIRYGDLLGVRYLDLSAGSPGAGRLREGETIPLARTKPALDLTSLFNGFKPLFDAIDPQQVNDLATEVVAVFDGRKASMETLLKRVTDVTSNLANHDQVIGELIGNLETVVGTAAARAPELSHLVDSLTEFTGMLAENNDVLIDTLDQSAAVSRSALQIIDGRVPELTRSVDRLNSLTGAMLGANPQFDHLMTAMPRFFASVNRAGEYGSWLNIYLCTFIVNVDGRQGAVGPDLHSRYCQ